MASFERVPVDQFVSARVEEQFMSLEYLRHRAECASVEKFRDALRQVPDVEPEEQDRLPAHGTEVADIQTAWSRDAGDLIEIAITLQRNQDTRNEGLDLFESLPDVGAYEATKALQGE